MKTKILALFTITTSFLSVFLIILLGKKLGISPQALHDGNLVFSPAVLILTLLILTLPTLPVFLVAVLYQKLTLSDLGFRSFRGGEFLRYLSLGAVIELAATGIAIGSTKQLSWAVSDVFILDWLIYYGWFLFLMLLNSVNEELIYRSYPLTSLTKTGMSHLSALLFSAVLFSLVHFLAESPSLSSFLYRLAFGILAGIIYLRKQNIWPVVGLHTGLNLVANGFSDSSWKTGALVNTGHHIPSEIFHWANFLVLSLAAVLYLYRYPCRERRTILKDSL